MENERSFFLVYAGCIAGEHSVLPQHDRTRPVNGVLGALRLGVCKICNTGNKISDKNKTGSDKTEPVLL